MGRAGVRIPLEVRLAAKVDRLYGDVPEHRPDLGPCWVWMGALNTDGYGVIRGEWDPETGRGPLILVHRAALSIALGRPLGEGMTSRHRCDNPRCARPRHLREGSQLENIADMHERGRAGYQFHPPKQRRIG